MKQPRGPRRGRRRPTDPDERARLLVEFERSDQSAAAFAREHGIQYTTFCGWRSRQSKVKGSADFVQVELPTPSASAELVIELGGHARVRLSSVGTVELVENRGFNSFGSQAGQDGRVGDAGTEFLDDRQCHRLGQQWLDPPRPDLDVPLQ